MEIEIHEDKTFDNIDFSEKAFNKSEFVNCNFIDCDFAKSNLSNTDFLDCSFTGSNISLAVVENTGFKNVSFNKCKVMGVDFSRSSNFLFAVTFTYCQLDYSSFFQKKMKKTFFTDCSLKEVDFTETDLSAAAFIDCNLLSALFVRTNLEKADFRSAVNYAFDPEANKMKNAKFSLSGLPGLLAKHNIEIE